MLDLKLCTLHYNMDIHKSLMERRAKVIYLQTDTSKAIIHNGHIQLTYFLAKHIHLVQKRSSQLTGEERSLYTITALLSKPHYF